MVARGMCALTGAEHAQEAWRRFFNNNDVVGIKVNPVGRKERPTDVASISSPALVVEVVTDGPGGVREVGVPGHRGREGGEPR